MLGGGRESNYVEELSLADLTVGVSMRHFLYL